MRCRYLVPLALAVAFLLVPANAGAYIFWTGLGTIGRAQNDGSEANQSFIVGSEIQPIAVDSEHLYYATEEEDQMGGDLSIARANLDGGERTLLPEAFHGPNGGEGIGAVDAGHIYWRDPAGIGRAKLDGTDSEPKFLQITGGIGGIAVYEGFVYWTFYDGGGGEDIGRANISTKVKDEEFGELGEAETGPRSIAVDGAGIFVTMEGGGPYEGKIARFGLGGGNAVLDSIPGVNASRGLAVDGSYLYWFNFQEGTGLSLARADVGGSGSTVDLHFVDGVEGLYIAVNSASSPPPLGPPPPPASPGESTGTTGTTPGSTPPSTSAPLKSLPQPKVKLNPKGGFATLTLTVPGPGVVVLSGAGIKTLRKTVKGAGPISLVVRPTAKITKTLKAHGKVKVAPKLTFTPPGGDPSSRVVKLTLRLG